MIESLQFTNFKNFKQETLHLGPFTIIVGTNASGKSNIRDAFRFLHGMGRNYTLPNIFGGRYGAGGQTEWRPIRGAFNEIIRFDSSSFSLRVKLNLGKKKRLEHFIKIKKGGNDSSSKFKVIKEYLKKNGKTIYTSHPKRPDPVREQDDDAYLLIRMAKAKSQKKYGYRIAVQADQPALTQICEHSVVLKDHKELLRQLIEVYGSMRFLDLTPERMRQPSFPGQTKLGDGGENLPTVLKALCEEEKRKNSLIDWIGELTPMDVSDFEFPEDPISGKAQLVIVEKNGSKVSANSASDGTLRFLAMLSALLGTDLAQLYVFEEIDNGIHPARLQLLLDLFERQTKNNGMQAITTTHSPGLLSMASDDTCKSMSVVYRNPEASNAVIRPIGKLPVIAKLRKSQNLGKLYAARWMENALYYTEEGEANEEDRE